MCVRSDVFSGMGQGSRVLLVELQNCSARWACSLYACGNTSEFGGDEGVGRTVCGRLNA